MAQPKLAVWAFLLAAVLFLIVAFIPVVRGASFNATFLALSVVFLILGVAVGKRKRGTDSPPPAA